MLNKLKYKDQRNSVNNLKKSAKIEFYVGINETLSDLKNGTWLFVLSTKPPTSTKQSPLNSDSQQFTNINKTNIHL